MLQQPCPQGTEAVLLRQVSATGQGAATVYRDATGQRVDLEELKRLQEAELAAKKKPKSEPTEWGKGIKQARLNAVFQQYSLLVL